MNLNKTITACGLRGPRSRIAFFLLFLAYSLWPLASRLYSQTELGSEDDLTVLGVSATAADPDVEIKGFTVFGSTQAVYTGAAAGPGNVVVNGVLTVSSGAYFVGNSTFSTISVSSITTTAAGVTFSTNVFIMNGNVGIGTMGPRTRLELGNDGAILAVGTYGNGWAEPDIGAGARLLWYPRKAAFRAGYANSTEWNNANIGVYSAALGNTTRASGDSSTALGYYSSATGSYSTAMGKEAAAGGDGSLAAGSDVSAMGQASIALGQFVKADVAANTIVFGKGLGSADANRLTNNIQNSLMVGFNSNIPTLFVGPSSGAGTTGNVGISTANPQARLDVLGSGTLATDFTQIWRNSAGTIVSSMSATGVLYPSVPATDNTKVAKTGDTMTGQLTNTSSITITGNGGVYGLEVSSNVSLAGALYSANGNVGIGTADPAGKLTVASGQILGPVGTAAAPAYSFIGDPDTGVYRSAANRIGFAANGAGSVQIGGGAPRLVVSNTSSFSSNSNGELLQLENNSGADDIASYFASGGSGGSVFSMRKSRGTIAAPTLITTADTLGQLIGYGYVGATNGYQAATRILFDSGGTISDSPTGIAGIMRFLTADTGGEPTERLTISNNGSVGIGTTAPAAELHVSSSNAVASSTVMLLSSGTAVGQELFVVKGNGNIGIGTTASEFKLSLDNDGGIIAKGKLNSGAALTTAGTGTRLIWYPKKAAFRAGEVTSTQWDESNIGQWSVALGYNPTASQQYTVALGYQPTASGVYSVSMGDSNIASGTRAFITGNNGRASGSSASVLGGEYNQATGDFSIIGGGSYNKTNGLYSVVPGGRLNTAKSDYSWAGGYTSSSTAQGAFTWADSQGVVAENAVTDRALFKNRGGFLITGSTNTNMSGSLNRGMLVTGDGLVGISTGVPGAALDVVSTGTTVATYAQIWRDSNGVAKASMTANGVLYATIPPGAVAGDNLGDHNATTRLNLGNYAIWSSSDITAARYQIGGSTVLAILPGTGSMGVGVGAGKISAGDYNTFVGYEAGRAYTGSYNLFMGYRAGYSDVTGNASTIIGYQAGYNTTSGNNTIIGHEAGYGNVNGNSNLFVGQWAGTSNTSGSNNVFLGGYEAGKMNTTGGQNIFVGNSAGYGNVTASDNTALGHTALKSNTYAQKNTAIGSGALYTQSYANGSATWDTDNLAIGYHALYLNQPTSNSNGKWNVAIGDYTLDANTTGTWNTAIGGNALGANITGSYNIAIGNALLANNGDYNIALGIGALQSNTSGSRNIAIGGNVPLWQNVTASDNIAIGDSALRNNTYAQKNVALGSGALYTQSYVNGSATWDTGNTAIGYQALYSNQPTANNDALRNTAVGYFAGRANTTGLNNTFVGYNAGQGNSSAGNNTFVGYGAGGANTIGTSNTFLGGSAAETNSTGSSNVFVGQNTGRANTTASYNVLVGNFSGGTNTTGDKNSEYGHYAGYQNVAGSANAIFGTEAGYGVGGNSFSSSTLMGYRVGYGLTTGSDNIFLGWQAGYATTSGARNVIIGYDQRTSAATASNELNIGGVLYGDLSAKTIGISTRAPQAALDVVSTGTLVSQYAQIWRDSNGVAKASMTANGVLYATIPPGAVAGDNLGDHNATQRLNMAQFPVINVSSVAMLGAGIQITTSVYAGSSGIFVSTSGSIYTAGLGNGTAYPNARGFGAVELQTSRDVATKIAGGVYSVIGGGRNNTAGSGATVSGGTGNTASGANSAILGGSGNTANNNWAIVAGGQDNTAGNTYTTVGGGQNNAANGDKSTVSGGYGNTAGSYSTTIGGGYSNSVTNQFATVAGGYQNKASGQGSSIGGGGHDGTNFPGNSAVGNASVVPGGLGNTAKGNYSLASGYASSSTVNGGFTWADSQGVVMENAVVDRTLFKNRGGFMVTGSTNTNMTGALDRGMIVTGNGLVGISTGVPYAALDVVSTGTLVNQYAQIWRNSAGTIVSSMTSTGVLYPAASGTDNTRVAKAGDTMTGQLTISGSSLTVIASASAAASLWVSTSVTTPHLYVSTNGNVGIWTANPQTALHLVGTMTATGYINVTSTSGYAMNGYTILRSKGSDNILVGPQAGNEISGMQNVFIGADAGKYTVGSDRSVIIGYRAGYNVSLSADNMVIIGEGAGYSNTSGEPIVFLGKDAGYSNTSGGGNTFLGYSAGYANTTGTNNAFAGAYSGNRNQTGSANGVFGNEAGGAGGALNSFSSATIMGYQAGNKLTTGNDNIFMGFKAGYSVTSGTGNIVIGYNKDTSAPSASNELNIGGVLYGNLVAKTIGISTRVPQAALDIVSTGTAQTQFAQIWRDGSGNIVSSVSATGVLMASMFTGPGISVSTVTAHLVQASSASFTTTSGTGLTVSSSAYLAVSGGNVGIGTMATGSKLSVLSASGAQMTLAYEAGKSADFTVASNGNLTIAPVSASVTTTIGSAAEALRVDSVGNVGIGTANPKSALHVVGLPVYANNAAAIAGGLTAGAFYRTGGDPDLVCVVH